MTSMVILYRAETWSLQDNWWGTWMHSVIISGACVACNARFMEGLHLHWGAPLTYWVSPLTSIICPRCLIEQWIMTEPSGSTWIHCQLTGAFLPVALVICGSKWLSLILHLLRLATAYRWAHNIRVWSTLVGTAMSDGQAMQRWQWSGWWLCLYSQFNTGSVLCRWCVLW